MVLQHPLDSHRVVVAGLFVGFQQKNDVSIRLIPFLFEANQVRDTRGGHEFVVFGASSVKITVLLQQLERIKRPVLASCFDDIEMGHQQDRLPRACAVQPRHEIPFARRRVEDLDVSAGVACGAEPGSHRLGRFRRVAGGCNGIDLHELPINIACELLLGGQRLWPGRKEPVHERDENEHEQP